LSDFHHLCWLVLDRCWFARDGILGSVLSPRVASVSSGALLALAVRKHLLFARFFLTAFEKRVLRRRDERLLRRRDERLLRRRDERLLRRHDEQLLRDGRASKYLETTHNVCEQSVYLIASYS
jgi:hypothetical protein